MIRNNLYGRWVPEWWPDELHGPIPNKSAIPEENYRENSILSLWNLSPRNKANKETFIQENLLNLVRAVSLWHLSHKLPPPSLPCPSSLEGGRLHLGRCGQQHRDPYSLAPSWGLWYLPRRGRLPAFLIRGFIFQARTAMCSVQVLPQTQ